MARLEANASHGKYPIPTTVTYNSFMQVLAKSSIVGATSLIEGILRRMELPVSEGGTKVAPNSQSYSIAIAAWTWSENPLKVEYALHLLNRMKQVFHSGNKAARPNVIVYNAVINCCCSATSNRSEAGRAAMAVFEDLQSSDFDKPDSITYVSMIKAIRRNFSPSPQRDAFLRRVLHLCQKDGLMNRVMRKE
jgi:hypothetical protein